MTVIAISPNSVAPQGRPDQDMVACLKELAMLYPIYMISNHGQPAWFSSVSSEFPINFIHEQGRQDGRIIKRISSTTGQSDYDVIVIASTDEDLHMGKNGGAVVLTANWIASRKLLDVGIAVNSAPDLAKTIQFIDRWNGDWWFQHQGEKYNIFSLANLSSYYVPFAQQQFAKKITSAVKQGGYALPALLAVTCKSLLKTGISNAEHLFWGVYPSSQSGNNDTEILSDFTHRLRTTLSRVHFAKRNKPLFIRHTNSEKRSGRVTTDRKDPTNQITTIHLNPEYRRQITNRNVLIVDDCTTYGLSFGVASSFLLAAGAKSVTGIALGKFGNTLHYYDIDLHSDPFQPVQNDGFSLRKCHPITGSTTDNMDELMILIGSNW